MRFKKGKSADSIVSYLEKGTELSGELNFSSGVEVNGVIRGKIQSEGILEIGPDGNIDADVSVRKISIRGMFRGTLHASDRVEIHKEGRVFGDIYSPCLIIEAGAVFEGSCNMNEQTPPVTKVEDENI
jgi:cytoskeletal protein CcmA (bactofilin family)